MRNISKGMIIHILVLFNPTDLSVFPIVSNFVKKNDDMKLLVFAKCFPDEESCELH